MKNIYRYISAATMRVDNIQMRRKQKKGSFVAMFHNVIHCETATQNDPFSVTENNLISFLNTCLKKGYEIISLDRLLDADPEKGQKCVITFDDGFASHYSIVNPLFKERNIPYTVFVTTSFLGQDGYLTETMLKELSQNELCTIAMHANKHLMFRYESDETLRSDYIFCKEFLQKITGKDPEYFAFPYGSVYACSKHNCRLVKSLGAKAVFVTRQRMLTKADLRCKWYIPRLNIPGYYNNSVEIKNRGIEV